MMQDMAILTGGRVVAEELGLKLENVQLSALGRCKRVVIDKDNTTLVGGLGKKADIQGRIAQLREQIKQTTSDYDREKLEERAAKLSGGVAVIKVGAATEVEMKEKKARVDDSVHALRAAMEEGIVPGGGVALVRAQKAVQELKLSEGRQAGVRIVVQAMAEPLRQIAANAGFEPPLVYNKVAEGKTNFGFNARTETFEDLLEAGVVDPAKVVRTALENAASIAALLITTEAAIAEKPKKKTPMPPMPPGGGMGGMGGMPGGMGGMPGMDGMGAMGDMGDEF
jgi:chaperonin GroEL